MAKNNHGHDEPVTVAPVLDRAIELFAANQRDDLAQRAHTARNNLQDILTRVVVVGEFKQGKSSLVNALLEAPVCRVDDLISTAVPTSVKYGDQASARLVRQSADGNIEHEHIDPATLRHDWPESCDSGSQVLSAEVTLPRPILAEGLEILDTPGTGGMGSYQASSTLAVLSGADAVLVLSDASQEYTAPELKFVQQASSLTDSTCCVVSKTDLYPHWRSIADADRQHMSRIGLKAPVFGASSVLRHHALRAKDTSFNQESGFPDLMDYIRNDVIDAKKTAIERSTCRELRVMLEHLTMGIRTELEALQESSQSGKVLRELETAKKAAAELNDRSARWQLTLNDGVGELLADIEYDLRDRLRRVSREGEMLIAECDPGQTWDEFGGWLADSVTQAVADNFVWAQQRTEWLTHTVASHFGDDGAVTLPDITVSNMEGVLGPIGPLDVVAAGKQKFSYKVLTGMRGSYGGVLMFGVLTGLAGMALINPISMTAGVLMGVYTYRQDSEQQLLKRRQEAKAAVRRLCDEATFQVSTESKSRLREVKRTLRDHFEEVGNELKRSIQESINRAQAAANTKVEDRPPRIDELTHELKKANMLIQLVDQATPAEPAGTTAPSEDDDVLSIPQASPAGSSAGIAS